MTVRSRSAAEALLYFVIHLLNEVVCFFMLYRIVEDQTFIVMVALTYNCLAFVSQFFWGSLRDLLERFRPGLISVPLLLSGFLLFFLTDAKGVLFWISLTLLSIGNALIHISGAEITIRISGGKLTPVAVFVSGGSFGVIAGQVLAATDISFWWIAACCVLMFPLVLIGDALYKGNPKECDDCSGFGYVIKGRKAIIVIFAAFFIVLVRAFLGAEIPLGWKTTLVQGVILYCTMGVGKALGGVLSDKIGIRKTALISIIGSLPFLILGNQNMVISLIGVAFFSMTMAVTLGMVISVMKIAPGAAFGVTTIALFFGSVASWFAKSDNLVVSAVIIVITSAVCFLLTMYILKPDKEAAQ